MSVKEKRGARVKWEKMRTKEGEREKERKSKAVIQG